MKYLLFSIFALAGCTTVYEVAPTTTEATITKPTAPPADLTYSDEAGFLESMNDKVPATRALPDASLLDSGWATCDGFASGLTIDDIVAAINSSSGGDQDIVEMLEWIAVNAVVYLCPEYSFKMDSA